MSIALKIVIMNLGLPFALREEANQQALGLRLYAGNTPWPSPLQLTRKSAHWLSTYKFKDVTLRLFVILALVVSLAENCLFGADDLRPPSARWLDGDRILVVTNAPSTSPWLVQLQKACAAGQPVLSYQAVCKDVNASELFRKTDRAHATGEMVIIAVGEADVRRSAKSKKPEYPDEFQRKVSAYAVGAGTKGAVVLLMSTSSDPQVISTVRAAANSAGVESTTMVDLVADLGRAAAQLPPRISISGDRVFTDATILTVLVGRIDPKSASLRWWREPGDESKAITQAIGKPIKVNEPGLIQVRIEDQASGTKGSASVFLRKMETLKPERVGKLTPGLTWRSGPVPLTKNGDIVLPTDVSGGNSGELALAEWPADAGEAKESGSAVVVVFNGYLSIRQPGMHRFIATGEGTLRLDIGDHLTLEHPSRDTRDDVTSGSVPLMAGVHRVRLVMARGSGEQPPSLTCRFPKSTIDGPLKLDELGTIAPIKTK